jgi:hypothetical protein
MYIQRYVGRLESTINEGRKIWELSPTDLKSYTRWYDYSRARDEMFRATDTPWELGMSFAPVTIRGAISQVNPCGDVCVPSESYSEPLHCFMDVDYRVHRQELLCLTG